MRQQDGPSEAISFNILMLNEESRHSTIFPCSSELLPQGVVQLNEALSQISRTEPYFKNCQVFLSDHANEIRVYLGTFPFEQNVRLSIDHVSNGCLHLSYRSCKGTANRITGEVPQVCSSNSSKSVRKIRERTISEAAEAVNRWKELYNTADAHGRRLYTLNTAARKVGVAKKSLDDYSNHLRIASEHNFNLEGFKQTKIGILRRFVKTLKEFGKEGISQEFSSYILDTDTDKYWVNFEKQSIA